MDGHWELVKSKPYLSMTAARKSAETLTKYTYMPETKRENKRNLFSEDFRDDGCGLLLSVRFGREKDERTGLCVL